MLRLMLRKPLLASFVLALVTTTLIGLLKFVIPYSETRDEVLDAFGPGPDFAMVHAALLGAPVLYLLAVTLAAMAIASLREGNRSNDS